MQVKKYTKNFSKNNNYKKPEKGSKTDQLQNSKAIKEKLKNYEKVNDIDEVPYNTYIRYITWRDGQHKFRLGGKLIKKEKDYIKLASNDFHWSVQKKHFDSNGNVIFETMFFKKVSQDQINKKIISDMQREIDRLKKENQLLRSKLHLPK